ncbi:hypothetical protein ACC702_32425 [Rhizobium ruizarguesonis]
MTNNSKTPPAKKTIQDPPEYEAVNKLKGHGDQAGYQQNGQQAVRPSEANMRYNPRYSEAAASSNPKDERDGREGTGNVIGNVSGDWLGGPQNGAEAPASNVDHEVNDRGRVPADDIKEKKAPKGSLSGGVDEQEGGGPDV